MWNEFEQLTQPASNVVTLDSNGSAEVYVSAYCDVEIKNSAGTTLRTVTVGNSASLVEVESDSFTGTDYDGSPASTAGEPITLAALLDKWDDSAGAEDWQVLVGGVATNLQTAFAGIAGLIFNVKDPTYGAVGDGVTDDTTAIQAATTAAAGAPVYFPPGTYKIDTLSLSGVNINWVGAGAGISIISGTTETTLIELTDNTNTGWKNFTGLSFTSSGSYTRLFALENNQNVSFSRCTFDSSECTTDTIQFASTAGFSRLVISDCEFTLGDQTHCLRNSAARNARHISVTGSRFTIPSGFTGRVIGGADFDVTGCAFDASAVTSGTYRMIDAEDATSAGRYVGNFSGNKFIDGGSDGYAFELTSLAAGCDFSESGNIFIGFVDPAEVTEVGHLYECTIGASYNDTSKIHLGSRIGRHLDLAISTTDGGDFAGYRCFLVADTIVINYSDTQNLSLTIDNPGAAEPADLDIPAGLRWDTIIKNGSGNSRDIAISGTNAAVAENSVANNGRYIASMSSYLESTGVVAADVTATVKTT